MELLVRVLGLAIARDFARAHGGDLILIPTAKGACFKLTLSNKGIHS